MSMADNAALRWVSLALAMAAASCAKGERMVLRDSEGRSFEAVCQPSGECALTSSATPRPSSPAPSEKAKPGWALVRQGRFFGACDTWSGSEPEIWDCRVITCSSDADCPAIAGVRTGMCMKGLCGDPARDIASPDSVMLCLAGTGPGYETPAQIERYAMGKECGTPCRVPTPCRQP